MSCKEFSIQIFRAYTKTMWQVTFCINFMNYISVMHCLNVTDKWLQLMVK